MFYKRHGLPEVDEIVLCKVTKLYPNSVFVDLLEYGESGIVHISEVSPGRIRNLRDFVSIDRQIVCKVLRVDLQNHHIDLSLRRVNTTQRQQKLEEIKQELKSELLIKNISKKLNKPVEQLYQEISKKVFKEYSHLYLCFHDVIDNPHLLEKLGIEKNLAKELEEAIIEKFKPKKILLKALITLQTYDQNGIDKIKSILLAIEKVSSFTTILFLGGGRYQLSIEDTDYKKAEKKLKQVEDLLEKFNDKLSVSSLEREKTE
ncbi:S1 RNA-binding domain-containing protein [Candidatus Woesearchaeota archaeon]|nr:S1 RNA-binding domain-containing protein [Candidatus Woesearchaeota archaeon]